MMRPGGMTVDRRGRGRGGDTGVAASAGDSTGRADAGQTVTLHIPLAFHQRRGRRVLVAPDGAEPMALSPALLPACTPRGVTSAVRALARAFRWRSLLETGAMATVHEIATAENINPSYVSRVMRLTLLSPEIVEAVAAGMEVSGAAALDRLMMPFPVDWSRHSSLGN